MTKEEILCLAQKYMHKRAVDIVLPGEFGEIRGNQVEVIFINPIALEPDVIVCPPDNRVLVDVVTKEVTWVEQM